MKVNLAQIYPSLGNLEKNYQIIENKVKKALTASAALIVFPELALTGYFLKDQIADLAPQINGYLKKIQELSEKIDILLGTIEESDEYHFYNSAYYFSGGRLIHKHRKLYLPTYGMFDEKRYFAAGEQLRAFQTNFGKAAMLICEDAWHLSNIYLAALDGAKIIFIISSSPLREGIEKYWQELNEMIAAKFNLVVVYCNRVGVEDGVTFWGGSEAYYPDGEQIVAAKQLDEEDLVADIDLSKVRESRLTSPLLKEERIDLVLKELERIWRARA